MRLRKLIVHGFKSFADRTEFLFDQPVTCIVGPNGCGKSNVVDAVKWVLGEQSAKSLRGDAMMDVIFNGSGSRKPAGMAEVTLVFENPARPDGSRTLNLPADEVAVGRRLYRDGTSEYTTNGHASRLKDVRDLFLDTGVGVDAYSVIEQGRVSRLLESNPQERRLIFEEAAGISRFKVKKKEAQRKLEKVDQNLLRVNDIVDEVQRRLRSVKVQAGRARTYQEHSARLAALRLAHALQEYHGLHHAIADLQRERDDTQFRLDDTAADLARRQNELADAREQADRVAETRQKGEHDRVQADGAIHSARQRQQYARQQSEQIDEQTQQLTRDRDRAAARVEEASALLDSESANFTALTALLDTERRAIDEKQHAFREGQLRLNVLTSQIDKAKQTILDLMRKLTQVSNRTSSLEIEKKNAAYQQQRQAERRLLVATEAEAAESQAAELKAKFDEALADIADRQSQLESRKGDAAALGKRIQDITEELGSAKEQRSGLLSRQKLLQDLENRREGVSEGVKSVLKQREAKFPFIRGIVADVIRVDVEHARIVEAALDGRDQWLIAASLTDAVESSAAYPELAGRVNIVDSSLTAATHDFTPSENWDAHEIGVRFAIDLVRFERGDASVVQQLLGKTIVVNDLVSARCLHAVLPAYRYVTPAGEVIESNGTLRVGPLTAAMGLISRRSELDALRLHVADIDARIVDLAAAVSDSNASARALDEELNQLRNAVYQANTARVEIASKQQQVNDRLSSVRRELPLLDRELQNLLEQTDRVVREQQTLLAQKSVHEADQVTQQKDIEELTAAHARLADGLKQTNEEMTRCRVKLGQVQEKQFASRQAVERLKGQVVETKQQTERLTQNLSALASRAEQIGGELQQAVAAGEEAVARRDELLRFVAELTEKWVLHQQNVKGLTLKVEELRAGHGRLEQEANRLAVRLGEQNVRRESLVGRIQEELQLDLPARFEELSCASGGYAPEALDWPAIAGEIKELREKIQRLGNVNLDAIGEMDELEAREKFLDEQVTDLAESKKQLEALIDDINRESSLRFEETFNAVREHFQGLFRRLFGGGKADLFLETEVVEKAPAGGRRSAVSSPDEAVIDGVAAVMRKIDPLDAGIEIIARPPGKQPVSISQLSGGEKTMTCIALLMSIFKSKPSPFCILDEVDAALDEANNVRFGLIVQEFLTTSQFVVITHHKRTMQIADVLYGVTMQEQGVSKRVAVKFDQIAESGRISEAAVREAEQEEALASA